MKTITSADNPRFRALLKLVQSARKRRTSGLSLLDGVHLVAAYAEHVGPPPEIALSRSGLENPEVAGLLANLPAVDTVLYADALFRQLSSVATPTGMIGVVPTPRQAQPATLAGPSIWLEDIQDPGNVGSILRSAAPAGIPTVCLSRHSVHAWSPRVLRAAMGAHFALHILEGADLQALAGAYSGRIISTSVKAGTLNDRARHDEIVANLCRNIPRARASGVPNVIAFFGNCRGRTDAEAIGACATALRRVAPVAEEHGVTVCVELLNSKVDHKDYMGDRTAFGVKVVQGIGSPRIKLLYDIYHMQIMEGDIVRTIRDVAAPHIGHVHTAGNPGQSDLEGMVVCARGLRRIARYAEEKSVNLNVERLNSRVNHPGYQCDRTEWGVALCEMVGSPRAKLLYDIYHMQIMEGDLIRSIRTAIRYIGHSVA